MAIYATGADGIRRRVDGGGTSTGLNVAGYVGEIVYFADSLLRPNHVWADGGAIDAQQWPELAEHAATAGWAQNEAGQYLTPDLRGRFLLGASASHAVGSTGGEESHTLKVKEMPAHTHGYYGGEAGSNNTIPWGPPQIQMQSGNGESLTISSGGSQPHNNMPPYYTVTPQIRAKVDVVYAKMPESIQASDVAYDNTTSGLQADKVQGAVDEIAEGLINISAEDLGITLGSGWEVVAGSVSVHNGVVVGAIQFNHYNDDHSALSQAPITLDFDYNIPIGTMMGMGAGFKTELDNAADPIQIYGYGPLAVGATTQRSFCIWKGIFSAPWNPTWAKKEGV